MTYDAAQGREGVPVAPGDPVHVPCRRAIELLTDYLEQALDPVTERDVRAHLEVCPPCVTFLEQLRTTRVLTGRVPDPVELDPAVAARLVDQFRDLLRG